MIPLRARYDHEEATLCPHCGEPCIFQLGMEFIAYHLTQGRLMKGQWKCWACGKETPEGTKIIMCSLPGDIQGYFWLDALEIQEGIGPIDVGPDRLASSPELSAESQDE